MEQSRQITKSSVTYLGNTYRFFGTKRRPLPDTAKGGCFVEDSQGRWYVCIQVETEDNLSQATSGPVGIDLGLKTLAALSDGTKIENPAHFRKYQTKLATAQRAGNKKRVRALHAKIKNARLDYLHKTSHQIASKYKEIYVGNVNASKLAKTRLAKSVHDASWSTLRSLLRYKASRHGGKYQEVDESFTTQRCSRCQEIPESSPKGIGALGIRDWVCSSCGVSHDRDVNSARNILSLGLSAQPRGDESRDPALRVAYGRTG